MNWHKQLLAVTLALAGVLTVPLAGRAQGFRLSASASPTSILVNEPVLFVVNVTNSTGLDLSTVFVTNAISSIAVVDFNRTTNSLGGAPTTGTDGIVFRINNMFVGEVARLSLTLLPVSAGPFTNEITVAAAGLTNLTTATNLVIHVSLPSTDLALGMTNLATGVLTNDTTTIGLLVTNLGPNSASGVVVTNRLPPSFRLLSVTPAGVSNSFDSGNLVLRLGTLASGSSTQLQVFVQPTNAGSFPVIASVTATNIADPNATNHTVTNNMTIGDSSGNLQVAALTTNFSLQTGLLEVRVRVTNTNATSVAAARVLATGLPAGARLYNASGTNSGTAYVQYNNVINPGGFVDLTLEYYVLQVATFAHSLSAFGVPAISLAAPPTSGVIITNKGLSSGGFLIEFPATIGRTYTIVYADNTSFSNSLVAQPAIVAPATQVQWIDNGPPKTVSHPTTVGQRYYRVFQSQ